MFFKKKSRKEEESNLDQDAQDLSRLIARAEQDSSKQEAFSEESFESWESIDSTSYQESILDPEYRDQSEAGIRDNVDAPTIVGKRAKYSAKIDKFLNSGIIIVGVLLVAVLLIAFLV